MNSMLNFKDKNVLVTGGSRGIGRACALLFAGLEANVIITYNAAKSEAEETIRKLSSPGNHRCYQLDVADASSVEKLYAAVMKDYATVDVLVNNAGVFLEHKIAEVNFEQWQQAWATTIQTNLIGVSNLCFLFAQQMIRQGGGKIVNISSRGAFRGEPDHPAYGASKAGLNSMSQSLALALAPYNISVTALAPGFVDTDMAADYLEGEKGKTVREQSPLKRVATAAEVANAVAMLASGGLEFMTGAIVDFNGASYLRT